jgi:hypothetical protein
MLRGNSIGHRAQGIGHRVGKVIAGLTRNLIDFSSFYLLYF